MDCCSIDLVCGQVGAIGVVDRDQGMLMEMDSELFDDGGAVFSWAEDR